MTRALVTAFAVVVGLAFSLGAAPALACDLGCTSAHGKDGKCSCSSAADCTCKKGTCKCAKCGGHQQTRMFESLKGVQELLKVPNDARLDATAGVFI